MEMETLTLPHLSNHKLVLALYRNVQNASHLRAQLLASNQEFEYAFLDASVLSSRAHLLAACFRAISDTTQNRLKTKNVHSEIVFALSPNNNISESFRRFGIQDTTTWMAVVKVVCHSSSLVQDIEAVKTHLAANVQGELVPFSDDVLKESGVCDAARVRKIYRFGAGGVKLDDVWTDQGQSWILGGMAMRGS